MPEPSTIPDDRIEGPYGVAEAMPMRDQPEYAETVAHWLITAPMWHPLWSQYVLACVRLRDNQPGFPQPKRQFPGATHEILCVTINPEDGPYTPESFTERSLSQGMPYLEPINVAHQIEGTDDEARPLLKMAAWGVCQGFLEPESSNGARRIRAGWQTSLIKTLAHIRGEEHAR